MSKKSVNVWLVHRSPFRILFQSWLTQKCFVGTRTAPSILSFDFRSLFCIQSLYTYAQITEENPKCSWIFLQEKQRGSRLPASQVHEGKLCLCRLSDAVHNNFRCSGFTRNVGQINRDQNCPNLSGCLATLPSCVQKNCTQYISDGQVS